MWEGLALNSAGVSNSGGLALALRKISVKSRLHSVTHCCSMACEGRVRVTVRNAWVIVGDVLQHGLAL